MENIYQIQHRNPRDCYINQGSLPCVRNSEYTTETSVCDIKYNVVGAPGIGLPYH